MPELPEVQTTVNGLSAKVKGLKIADVWTDYNSPSHAKNENIKNPKYFLRFKKEVIGAKITHASRQGKNVLIHLSHSTSSGQANKKTILIHMKMTGHLMYGEYVFNIKQNIWEPVAKTGPLTDPYNKYIHLVFIFKNNKSKKSGQKQLVFSDLRKFAKVFIFETENIQKIEDLMNLGPDPLTKELDLKTFLEKMREKKTGKIKQVLMDQHVISGIGNIYSDEMLWKAGIHPLSVPSKVPTKILKKLYTAMKEVLKKGIDFGGDSDSDYRNIDGEPGKFQHKHNAYRRTGKSCPKKDSGIIKRIKVGGRSAHFCDVHQKLYK